MDKWKLVLLLFFGSLNLTLTAQVRPGRIKLPPASRSNTKAVNLKDTESIVVKPFSLDLKNVRFSTAKPDPNNTDVEEPLSQAALDKIEKLQKKKAAIIQKKQSAQNFGRRLAADKDAETVSKQVTREGSGCPPDNSVAVSRNGFVVAADNRELGFYDNNGNELQSFNYADLYEPVRSGLGEDVCDPKLLYDYEADRFIFFTQAFTSDLKKSECILAFSKGEDPRDGWNVYVFHQFRNKEKNRFDYPGLAYNEEEVFLCGNLFGPGSADNVIFQFDKDDGYEGREMNGLMWMDVKQANGQDASTIFPLQTIPNYYFEKDMLFVSVSSNGGTHCYYYRITDRLNKHPQMSKHEIDIPDYDPPTQVPQKGTTDKLDGGVLKVRGGLFVDNRIYFVFCKPDKDGFNGIVLTRIRITNFSVKTKYFSDNHNSEYTYPNIVHLGKKANDRRLLLVYQRSGIDHWPQVRYRKIKSNMSGDGGSVTLQSSESFREACGDRGARWGDYIGIQRQGNSKIYWIMGHTANSNHKWRSHLIKLGL